MKRFLAILLLMPALLLANSYSLEELISHGLKHSYQVQMDEQSAAQTQSSLRSAKWNLLPEASVNASVSQDFAPLANAPKTNSSAGITLAKTISLNDQSYFSYRQATLDQKKAQMRLQAAYKDYAYSVFQAYVELLSANTRKSALEENLAIQNRVWEQSQTLLRLGKTTPFEVKQNEIAVMNSQISIIQLENSIASLRTKLFSLVRMEDNGFELEDLELVAEDTIPAFDAAQINQLLLLKEDMKKSELNLKQANLDLFPQLSLSYNFNRRVYGADFDFDQYSTSHGVGLNLSYALLSPFKNGESKLRTKIGMQIEALNYEDTLEKLKREYDINKQELEYLLRLDELYSERLEQASAQVQIAEERYRLGMIQLLDLDKSRTDYISSDIEYNTNRYQIISKQEAINYLLSSDILGKW